MKFKIKETYLLFLIVVGLVSLATYSTFALFTATTEITDVVDFTATLSTNNSIAEYEMITVPAGETKIIELNVTNSYQGILNYLAWYEMVNPSTIDDNDNISLGIYTEQNSTPASGTIATDNTITLLVGITNNTDTVIIVNIGVSGSVDENMNLSGNKKSLQPGWTPEKEVIITEAFETLTSLNLTSYLQEGTPSFSKTSCSEGCDETTVGIYETVDDLGTSYYFRGDFNNNYVKFGKHGNVYIGYRTNGNIKEFATLSACQNDTYYNNDCTSMKDKDMYWRILRINGDGSIRMIYDGTSAHENGESNVDRVISVTAYNDGNSDNSFVGYMNGINGINFPNGTTNSTSYSEAHTNITSSKIKTYLEETWYQNLNVNKQYIVDGIFCNDRTLSSNNSSIESYGFGTIVGNYGPRDVVANGEPSLTCERDEDKFTLVNGAVEGNDKLTAPIGLITVDEAVLAGSVKNSATSTNVKYYLYTGYNYWTMSPYGFSSSYSRVYYVNNSGKLNYNAVSTGTYYLKPVINISADALKYGTGEPESPFSVEEESTTS